MQVAAFVMNVALLFLVAYLVTEKGFPTDSDMFIFVLLITAPLVNIAALLTHSCTTKDSNNLLILYIRRKALEEKKKIAALQDVGRDA
jgi:hypothetical protein